MLEAVGRGDAADLRRRAAGRPIANPFIRPPRNASPTPVGSATLRGATAGTSTWPDFVMTDEPFSPFVTISDVGLLEHFLLAHAGLLPDQLELVVVADQDMRAVDAVLQLVAGHARALLAGIEDERNLQRPALLRVLTPSRPDRSAR